MKYIFIIVLIIFILYFIWELTTRKYVNPYTLTIIFGKKGCGKSTLLQKLAHYYHKKGFNVYCNVGDSFDKHVHQIQINDLPRLSEAGHAQYKDKNTVLRDQIYQEYQKKHITGCAYSIKPPAAILCDEINLLWDNRNFKNFSPELQRYFRLQRHYRHVFIGFSQTFDCDKKIRDLSDKLLLCNRVARVWIRTKAYIKKVVVVSPQNENSRETATMTDDFIPLGFIHDLFSPYQAWLPAWIKKHDSFK